MKTVTAFALAMLTLSACTQQNPARITHNGNNFYGRDAGQSVARGNIELRNELQLAEPAPLDEVQVAAVETPAPVIANSIRMQPLTPPPATLRAPPAPALQPMVVPKKELGPLFDLSEIQAEAVAPITQEARVMPPKSEGLIWPVEGEIISSFGKKKNGLSNDGVNIKARMGEPIWAASTGEVVYAGNELKGYGNMVIVKHAGGMMTSYAHASDILVKKGQQVAQGDLLGYVGRTGSVTEPQLHFGIRMGKRAVNPESKLPRRLASRG